MINSSVSNLIELEKEYFGDYNKKDYAKFIADNRNIFNDEKNIFDKGPVDKKWILLAEDGRIRIWFAPAGNIPINPEIIILGQATSIPAMDSIMTENVNRKEENKIRKILINSSYKGIMLRNLGSLLNFLKIGKSNCLSFDLKKEWENIEERRIGVSYSPNGRLFKGYRDTKIMFTQFCMHCATTYNNDKKTYSTTSVNFNKYIKLNKDTYGEANYRLLIEKYFNSDAKLLITLSKKIFSLLRKRYKDEYPNIGWLDCNTGKHKKSDKLVTWIPHPSPGNLFYNKTKNKKGVFDAMIIQDDKGKKVNIKEACSDYPAYTNQAKQVAFLKQYFEN